MVEEADSTGRTTVTYLGHASLLLESGGEVLVTDPMFGDRVGRFFTKRSSPSQFRPEALRGTVGALISHAHHDHLDYPSLGRLGLDLPVVVPWGLSVPMQLRRFTNVQMLRPWEGRRVGRWQVTAVPSRHFGGRLPMLYTSGHQGYVASRSHGIYFAGDTGLDVPMFQEIGRRFDLDLAILPIAGAVFPWYRRNHMNGVEALVALRALGARRMLPMHFETFPASFEPVGAARQSLLREADRLGMTDRVVLLGEGATLTLEPPGEGSTRRFVTGTEGRAAAVASPSIG